MKRYKYLIFSTLITLGIVIYSCFSFYNETFSYKESYYKIKENCYEEKDTDSYYCTNFKQNGKINKEALNNYIVNSNPEKVKKEMNVITTTCEIVENSFFRHLQMFSPLIILFAVIGYLQAEFNSGYFKNYLLREDYKKYIKKKYEIVFISSLIMPISLILIFIISCFMANFNFDFSNIDTNLAVYDEWKYNNFILYGFIICLIQYFISMLYANIGVLCVRKNKNTLVSIVMGYLYFILVYIFIYIVIYVLFINKLLGFKELTEYFNIIGYWFFDSNTNIYIVLILSVIFYFVSYIYVYFKYKGKENLVLAHEKQLS